MRMVSKKIIVASLALTAASSIIAYAVSPNMIAAKSALQPIEGAEAKCADDTHYKDEKNKPKEPATGDCQKCKKAIKKWVPKAKAALSKAEGVDSTQEAAAVSSLKGNLGGMSSQQKDQEATNAENNDAAKNAKTAQSKNFGDLSKEMKQCAEEVKQECGGDLAQEDKEAGEKVGGACEKAGAAADKGAAEAAKDAGKMGENEKKSDQNAKGMEMPKMPEMPKQEPKQAENKSDVSTNTATNTAAASKVSDSNLGGNQFAANKVGIGGTDGTGTDAASSNGTGAFRNGGSYGDSGISASGKSFENNGLAGGSGSGSGNSSGSSSAGGLGSLGGGGSSGEGGANHAGAASTLPAKTDDIEAFGNGGARPSYLGVKAKGGELEDLGLGDTTGAASHDAAETGDRSIASTDQNAGIHTESNAGSLFMMVRERLKEVGRRGAI